MTAPAPLARALLAAACALLPCAASAQPADSSGAPLGDAALGVERAQLDLARAELRALSTWTRLRPQLGLFASVSARGLAFPAITAQGYDPVTAAIARWPGDTWGATASWSLEQLLDRRPLDRARAAVALAQARLDAARARHAAARADSLRADAERAARLALARHRDALAARQLRVDADFLARRADALRELLRLATLRFEAGQAPYETLARGRLALLAAEHAAAAVAARLATLDAGGGADLALAPPPETLPPDLP